jgi:hypothetical protein
LGSRIENFSTDKPDEDDYQIEKAKIAIASGKIYGLGPGKNLLPQSSSDFIYAIIVEEYGLIGGFGVLILYLLLLFRFVTTPIPFWKVGRRWTRFPNDISSDGQYGCSSRIITGNGSDITTDQ